MLEDAQKQAGRAGRTITDELLLLFASTAILTTESYSRSNNNWEDRAKDEKIWDNWNTGYKKAHPKVRVKAQAAEGTDKFGAANVADRVLGVGFNKNIGVTKDDGGDKVGLKALKGYFNNLTDTTTKEKKVLEQLVASNSKLAATNEELVAVVKN